jgi:DNA mismatch repair protein MutL
MENDLIKSISMFEFGNNETMVKSADHIMNMYDRRENPNGEKIEPKQQKMDTMTAEKFKILGTIFNTYILIEDAEKFHIIDQHAAAERVLYDKLSKQIDQNRVEKQRLIEPEVLALTTEEMTKMDTARETLNACGIECAPFGKSCYRITAVPVIVAKHGIDTLLDGLLGEIRVTRLTDILKNKIITQCCRAAIKAGQQLPEMEIRTLLNDMQKAKITPTCPHGRPIIKSFSKTDIEKMFARK